MCRKWYCNYRRISGEYVSYENPETPLLHLFLIHKALYAHRLNGICWHESLIHVIQKEAFTLNRMEPDIWIMPMLMTFSLLPRNHMPSLTLQRMTTNLGSR